MWLDGVHPRRHILLLKAPERLRPDTGASRSDVDDEIEVVDAEHEIPMDKVA